MNPTTEKAFETYIEDTLYVKNHWHKLDVNWKYRTALISAAVTGKIRLA
jgi:hypothetical protein